MVLIEMGSNEGWTRFPFDLDMNIYKKWFELRNIDKGFRYLREEFKDNRFEGSCMVWTPIK